MAENAILQARVRTDAGKQAVKRVRRQGLLPAVVYGEGGTPVNCTVNRKELETLLHLRGRNALVSLVLENGGGGAQTTIIKEIQHHPLGGEILHVDFHRISMTEKITVEVSIEGVGTPVGVRTEGGILEHMLHRVEIVCLPSQIPERIQVNVGEMQIGDTIHVSDLAVPEGVETVTEGDRSVFVVVPPTVVRTAAEEGEEEAEEEEATEPEVIERGKKDEEGEEDEKR